MIAPLFCVAVLITLFVAIAFSVSLLWVKIICWLVVTVIVIAVIFTWWKTPR
jgi:hypothetical protein